MTTSTERKDDYQARGLAELRRRAGQSQHRGNHRWAALDSQGVDLQRRLDAARRKGDTRQAEYARQALAAVVHGMGRLLASERPAEDPRDRPFTGDPQTRRT